MESTTPSGFATCLSGDLRSPIKSSWVRIGREPKWGAECYKNDNHMMKTMRWRYVTHFIPSSYLHSPNPHCCFCLAHWGGRLFVIGFHLTMVQITLRPPLFDSGKIHLSDHLWAPNSPFSTAAGRFWEIHPLETKTAHILSYLIVFGSKWVMCKPWIWAPVVRYTYQIRKLAKCLKVWMK